FVNKCWLVLLLFYHGNFVNFRMPKVEAHMLECLCTSEVGTFSSAYIEQPSKLLKA
uniref:Uncharacterized protein n=1 Tax=Aegilops tauschii subsp. strangulata TaxID=200361 RepID=A0A453HAF4_AEGTS